KTVSHLSTLSLHDALPILDVPLRVVRVEEQQLRDDDIRDFVVDLGAQEHDAVHEQPAEDVVRALAPTGALDDEGRINLVPVGARDRKSTRLNSSHQIISYA